jgi:hypothetical protein
MYHPVSILSFHLLTYILYISSGLSFPVVKCCSWNELKIPKRYWWVFTYTKHVYTASWCLLIITIIKAIIFTKFHWCWPGLFEIVSHGLLDNLRRLVQSFYRGKCCVVVLSTDTKPSCGGKRAELPLIIRKEKLTLQYITKLKSTYDNAASSHLHFRTQLHSFFCSRQSPLSFQLWESEWKSYNTKMCQRASRYEWIRRWIPEIHSNKCVDESYLSSPVSPWLVKPPEFICAILAPNQMYPQTCSNQNWSRLLADFDFQGICTDGLKAGAAVAAAATSGQKLLVRRLPNISYVFSAEARGISTFADRHRVRCSWWVPHTNRLYSLPSEYWKWITRSPSNYVNSPNLLALVNE